MRLAFFSSTLVFLFLCSFKSIEENNATQIWNSANKSFIARIDSMNQAAFDLRKSDQATTVSLLRRALSENEKKVYEEGYYLSILYLGINFTNLHKYDSAFYYLKIGGDYFSNDKLRLGLANYYTAMNYSDLRDFTNAKKFLGIASLAFEEVSASKYQAYVENSLGIIDGRQSNFSEALGHFLRAYEIKEKADLLYDEELSNISLVYQLMGKYDQSLLFSKKSLEMVVDLGDSLGISQVMITIGSIFNKSENYDSALIYYEKSFLLASRNQFWHQAASSLSNKANTLQKIGDYIGAKKSLRMSTRISDKKEGILEYTNNQLAAISEKLKQPDSVIFYALQSYETATITNNQSLALDNAKLLAKAYEDKGNLKQSTFYFKEAMDWMEKQNKASNEEDMTDLRVRIETIEKTKEIDQLQSEAQIAKLKRTSLIRTGILSMVALLSILVALSAFFWNKNKIQKLKEAALKRDLERNKRDLHLQTMNMIRLNNDMQDLEENLKEIRKKQGGDDRDVKRMLTKLQMSKSLEKEWDSFNMTFSSIHHGFISRLRAMNMDLTTNEIRLCTLLKLNLSNSEVSSILNIESKSVRMSKYRLKKRLGLDEGVEITSFLQSI